MIVLSLARKPVQDTATRNVQKHGTGGINIDACRIGVEEMKVTASNGVVISTNRAMAAPNTGRLDMGTKTGRWPANVIFEHLQGCQVSGSRDVRGGSGTYCPQWPAPCQGHGDERCLNGVTGHGSPPPGWVKPSRMETMPVNICQPGCPVTNLDPETSRFFKQVGQP